jgi:predicted DCC family thiol-disulfide oxidoreductase YuxK
MTEHRPLVVLYNAECPICRAEIDHYAAYAAPRDLPLRFDPISDADLAAWDLTAEEAARRLHVQCPDGRILSGMPAFRALWAAMPRYRTLARITGLPVLRPVTGWIYNRVLAPALYRAHRRRQARAARSLS